MLAIILTLTAMDRSGRCAQCGGNSIVLASKMSLRTQGLRTVFMPGRASGQKPGQLIPFEFGIRAHSARATKKAM